MALNFNKLAGKHVLLIGGSTGLGRGAAEGALVAGAKVTIASSTRSKLDTAEAELKAAVPSGSVKVLLVDLLAPNVEQTLEILRQEAINAHGPINHIVYTASDAFPVSELQTSTPSSLPRPPICAPWSRSSSPSASLLVAGLPKNRFSSITFTGGNISMKPTPGFLLPAYIGAGMEGATRALALELAPIRVNIVAPGFVETGLWGEAREKLGRAQDGMVLTQKAGQVEDVVEAYLYLMRDGNATGQVIRSESGSTLLSRESGGR